MESNQNSVVFGQFIGPRRLLSESWLFLKANWKILLPITLIPILFQLISYILRFLLSLVDQSAVAVIMFTLIAFLFSLAQMITQLMSVGALIYAIHDRTNNSNSTLRWKDYYKVGIKYFWSIVLISIIIGAVSIGSVIFLIIPAIIIGIYTAYSMFALIVDDKRGYKALEYSYSLVKNRAWKVLGRLLYMTLIIVGLALVLIIISGLLLTLFTASGSIILVIIMMFIAAIALIIFSMFSTILATIYSYKTYSNLKQIANPNISTAGFRKWLITFTVIGPIVFVSIIIFVMMSILIMSSVSKSNNNLRSGIGTNYGIEETQNVDILDSADNSTLNQLLVLV